MKKEDEIIKNALNINLDIPEEYNNMVSKTLRCLPNIKCKRKISQKFRFAVASVCCVLVLTTGIVHAERITNSIKNFFNNNKGIDKAIENGYIQYENIETIPSNETDINVENFLMDDYNLSLTFKLNFKNETLKQNEEVEFVNMIITDENDSIFYGENKEYFENYCIEKQLNYKYGEYRDGYITTESNWYNANVEQNKIIYNLYANKFPKCKKIFIKISNIYIKDSISGNLKRVIEGNWNIELDVPEKFVNRECIVYTVTECSDPELNITEFSVYDTCSRFECSAKLDPLCNEEDTSDVKNSKLMELLEWEKNNNTKECYLEDEMGNVYLPIKSSSSDSVRKCGINGEFYCVQMFDFTKYDQKKKLKLHFYINVPQENKEIVIELERKN